MDDKTQDDELALRQGGRLFPIGQALRATYDAENHETLGNDVAGLMINLSHVEPPAPAAQPCVTAAPTTGRAGGMLNLASGVLRALHLRS